ncbi:MAG TPA: hypothetical protein VFB68_00350 [Xanthobacteraceae bacterium]|nr:hypothetical protein [Xanthobacteraceae bacterium]
MSVILLVLGILLAAAGGALIGFGIPIKELSLGGTAILAGAFAVVGGLLLVGLSAVVTELARVTAALKGSQVPAQAATARAARIELPAPPAEVVAREPVKEVVNEEPAPASVPVPAAAASPSPAAVEVSASAIERLRSSIPRPDKGVLEAEEEAVPLSPNGQQATHHVEPPPQVEPVPRSAGAAAVETREPRLDFLFRPRQVRQAAAQQPAPQQEGAFDSLWPKRPGREGQPDPRLEVARAPATVAAAHPVSAASAHPAAEVAPAPVSAPQERGVAILKSGVVDGMAYTLYADGSIEAQLPQGTVRFGSIAELRAHIENNA